MARKHQRQARALTDAIRRFTGHAGDDLERGVPWGMLAAGVALYLLRGFDFSFIAQVLDEFAATMIGLGLFVFIVFLGYATGTWLGQLKPVARVLAGLGMFAYFAGLQVLPAVGSWLSASFQAEPMFSLPFLADVQARLSFLYLDRFASPELFKQSIAGYAGLFDGIDGIGELLGAIVSLILNIVPDWLMYWMSAGSTSAATGVINFAVGTLYWFGLSGLLMVPGYRAGRNRHEGDLANEAYLDELDQPGPRYALLLNRIEGGAEAAPDNLLAHAASMLGSYARPVNDMECFDTGGTPEGAAAAAEAAVAAGHRLVFGPILPAEVEAAGAVLRRAGVPAITFTLDEKVLGDGVYSLAWRIELEVSTIATYARRIGIAQVAAFLPARLGATGLRAIGQAITGAGVTLVASESYGADTAKNAAALRKLAGTMTQPTGLLMIEPQLAAKCMKALANLDPRPVMPQLLGAGPWYLDEGYEPALEGALFAAPAGYAQTLRAGKNSLKPYALHGGTAVWLARELDLVSEPKPEVVRRRLERPEGFELGGRVWMRGRGLARRELAVFKVKNGDMRIVHGGEGSVAKKSQDEQDRALAEEQRAARAVGG